jgi:hypothetical protein
VAVTVHLFKAQALLFLAVFVIVAVVAGHDAGDAVQPPPEIACQRRHQDQDDDERHDHFESRDVGRRRRGDV